MDLSAEEWTRPGATLSDKTTRAEFGLTQDEIIAAIRAGKLQYRQAELKQLRTQLAALEERRSLLLAELGEPG